LDACNATLRRRRDVSGHRGGYSVLGQIALLCGEMEGATACARRRRRRRAADECHYEMKLYVGRESWTDGCLGLCMGNELLAGPCAGTGKVHPVRHVSAGCRRLACERSEFLHCGDARLARHLHWPLAPSLRHGFPVNANEPYMDHVCWLASAHQASLSPLARTQHRFPALRIFALQLHVIARAAILNNSPIGALEYSRRTLEA
jgi:hypothetical protein